ncbi:ATP-binding protein [Sphingobacterium mizutaii]|uniref:ATP/GTP-binding protein n=1 Tax=Sphingobacterium mizutaii TaxID=1010 RepID=UPI001BE426AE|nr:ATP-binding protein [Sphingobacterium mizutaii]
MQNLRFAMRCPEHKPRIVISGTYCTGKTSLSIALSLATGIPTTHAPTMREILPWLFPGTSLKDCSYAQLLRLGMERFERRVHAEAGLSTGFISDGCPLQEWLYGSTRLITGAYPEENSWTMLWKKLKNYREFRDFELLLAGFEKMAKTYTKNSYDIFFHLPVEFPFIEDGHRPTSERFREESERILINTYRSLQITPIYVSGTLENRLKTILSHLNITSKIPLAEAVDLSVKLKERLFDRNTLE